MMSFGLDMGWRLLRGAAGMVIDSIGIGGVIALAAGLILLLTLSVRVTKFLGSRKGMAITAAVLVVALFLAGREVKPRSQAVSQSLPSLMAPESPSADVAELAAAEEAEPAMAAEMERPAMAANTPPVIPDLTMPMMAAEPMMPMNGMMPGGMGGPVHVPPIQVRGQQGGVTHHAVAKPASVSHAAVSAMPSAKPAATHAGPAAFGPKVAAGKATGHPSANTLPSGITPMGGMGAGPQFGGNGTPKRAGVGRNVASANAHAAGGGMMGGMTPVSGLMPGNQFGGGNASAGGHEPMTAQQVGQARRQAAMANMAIANQQMDFMMGQMMQGHMGMHPMGGMHPGVGGHQPATHPGGHNPAAGHHPATHPGGHHMGGIR